MVQLAPAATVVPQVLVWAKLTVLPPLKPRLLSVRVPVPVFCRVRVWAALVDSAGAVKVSAELVNVIAGPVMFPVSVTDCGEPVALSAMERLAA